MPLSNGNSFNGSSAYSNGQSMDIIDRNMEPWFTSALLRPIQDRRGM